MTSLLKILSRMMLVAAFVAALSALTSCSKDKISYDGALKLEFSVDTISFDTIFTQLGSTTKMFKVYNRASNRIVISSINLADGSQYQINVDGVSADNFTDVYMNANDSMTIFVQVKIDPSDKTLPFIVFDSINFLTNGNNQNVYLQAYGQEAVRFNKKTISADTILTADLPYLITDTLKINEGVKLTIQEGCKLYFRKNGLMYIDGTLDAQGSLGNFVIFRGDRSDYMNTTPPLSYDMSSAQWQGIVFTAKSSDNSLKYTDVRNSTIGIVLDSTSTDKKTLTIESSIIRNSSGNLISSDNAYLRIYNSLVYNAGGYVLELAGGDYEFCHVTFVNYYGYSWGSRTAPLTLMKNTYNQTPVSFNMSAANCFFYGSYSTEITFEQSESAAFSYMFTNCFIKISTSSLVAGHYVNCLYNTDPLFAYEAWDDEYAENNPHLYDFHLQTSSPAVGKGDVSTGSRFPFDLDGNARLNGSNCSIGAYEVVNNE